MRIRAYRDEDWAAWLRMECALFPQEDVDDLIAGMREFCARPDAAVFIAEEPDGTAVGFVEVGSRDYAEDATTSPVGYIEAWYVDAHVRRTGYGRALLAAAEEWARHTGCSEIASDAQINNTVSYAAHLRAGYAEVDRVVQFRKALR